MRFRVQGLGFRATMRGQSHLADAPGGGASGGGCLPLWV